MIVSINQPAYLPWLGYFHRIAASDVHVVLDHVQLEKNSFTNRNKVRTKEGWCWATIPLRTKGRFGSLAINTVEIDNTSRWTVKHWKTVQSCYSRAAYFSEHKSFLESVYSGQWIYLMELLQEMTTYFLTVLGISTPVLYSSKLSVEGSKEELVLNICKKLGASCYLSGVLGKKYLREEMFAANSVAVAYQDYKHPAYAQQFTGFEPNMAVIDLLMNCGPKSQEILMDGNSRNVCR